MMPVLSRLSVLYQRSQVAFRQKCYSIGNKLNSVKNPNIRTFSGKSAWEVDTNVAKDVVLYSHENSKFHKNLNLFAITQLGFWLYLAEFSMSTLRDVPVKEEELDPNAHWYQKINLGENKYRRGITTMCIAVGFLLLGGSWMYSLRAVRNIVLRKGGNDVTIITHAPLNKLRHLNVPLKNVSATQSRSRVTTQLPIKVKSHMGYFMVDPKGEFKNGPLFDATVGLKRILTK